MTGPLRLSISSRSGRVHVHALDGAELDLGDAVARPAEDGSLTVEPGRAGSGVIDLVCPTGTELTIGTASGRVELSGRFGAVRVVSGSGRVEIEQAASVDVRTASGRVEVRRCDGACRVVTASGRIEIGQTPRADVSTASGRVTLGTVAGDPDVRVRTVSGTVAVTVPPDVQPDLVLTSRSGSVTHDCHPGDDGCVAVETMSGRIDVRVSRAGR